MIRYLQSRQVISKNYKLLWYYAEKGEYSKEIKIKACENYIARKRIFEKWQNH
jgi:hypothetical protein